MVWQQWVLLSWICFRIPFGVNRELTRDRKLIPSQDINRSITIGIVAYLIVAAIYATLIVTI